MFSTGRPLGLAIALVAIATLAACDLSTGDEQYGPFLGDLRATITGPDSTWFFLANQVNGQPAGVQLPAEGSPASYALSFQSTGQSMPVQTGTFPVGDGSQGIWANLRRSLPTGVPGEFQEVEWRSAQGTYTLNEFRARTTSGGVLEAIRLEGSFDFQAVPFGPDGPIGTAVRIQGSFDIARPQL